MLRPDFRRTPRPVSHAELGIAALLLLVGVVLTTIVVPALA